MKFPVQELAQEFIFKSDIIIDSIKYTCSTTLINGTDSFVAVGFADFAQQKTQTIYLRSKTTQLFYSSLYLHFVNELVETD